MRKPVRSWILPVFATLGVLVGTFQPLPATDLSNRFKLHVREAGVYRVSYEDLAAVTPVALRVEPSRIGMSVGGEAVPLWIEDGGDGVWDTGDWIEFVGRHRPGTRGHFNEFSPDHVYRLDLETDRTLRMRAPQTLERDRCEVGSPGLETARHFEQNLLRVRFSPEATNDSEVWFWRKLTQIDTHPFELTIDLGDLAPPPAAHVNLRIGLRGWSSLPGSAPATAADHRLELAVNDRPVGKSDWNNTPEGHVLALALPRSLFTDSSNRLTLRVPERRPGGDSTSAVDVVLLDWIELRYPRRSEVTRFPARFRPVVPADCLVLTGDTPGPLVVYGDDGSRAVTRSVEGRHVVGPWRSAAALYVVAGDTSYRTPRVVVDRPSSWSGGDPRADLIVIAHPRLLDSVRPLVEFHTGRGLEVALVDVEDVYDEFSHAMVDPQAIRDFLEHAGKHWSRPAPRYVLLVGDASWDPANPGASDRNYADWTYRPQHRERFGKNDSTPYPRSAERNHRNLIPTWSQATREGHAASDHGFVNFGEGGAPAMAIGRWPVTEAEEVRAIVRKTLSYAASPEPGAWRRRAIWITNEEQAYQRRTELLVRDFPQYEARRIYPSKQEPSNAGHRETLIGALNDGSLFVHFLGHGGRYIWRTGPPDLSKNHDLFTLEDLDRLGPSERLPIVFSMTCYSAPFDHPNADSIGEKFLRLPGRGAVVVIAASWRNSPTERMSRLLLEEFSRSGTLGDAFLRAKLRSNDPDFLNMYNLLGDPATPIALESPAVGGAPR